MKTVRVFQKGFNYSQDGQGNRLVYHLQGCNMKCPWCANPEGMQMEGVLCTDKDWIEDQLCPKGAVSGGVLNRNICRDCPDRICLTKKYRNKGIYLSYEEYTTDEIVDEVMRSSPMFYDGGGVTFTGGEATIQFEVLKELLERLTKAGIHTAIETNGSHPRLPELFPCVGQLIMDCKHWNQEKHLIFTGVPIGKVNQNLLEAARVHPHLDIRIPLIGGVNDSEEDMEMFISFFKEIINGTKRNGQNVTFEVLKYHEFGKNKWAACGLEYVMTDDAHVTTEQIQRFRQKLIRNHLNLQKS